MNGDIQAIVDGKLVKRTEGGLFNSGGCGIVDGEADEDGEADG